MFGDAVENGGRGATALPGDSVGLAPRASRNLRASASLRETKNPDNPVNPVNPVEKTFYTGFTVYNVNNYDVFRNPVEARDLLVQALELQPLPKSSLYDGEKDGAFYKIMPVNRLATKADLNEIVANIAAQGLQGRY